LAEIQTFCRKILCEKSTKDTPLPDDEQVQVAALAFAGKGINDIRDTFPGIHVMTITSAIRTVRNAIRRNEAPESIREGFPYLCIEQQAYVKLPQRRSIVVGKIRALARVIEKPTHRHFPEWITRAKVLFAPVAVPLTIEKVMEGVEEGDSEMVKIATQIFHLVPTGGKGLTLAQQFNMPGSQEKKSPAERRAPYFEKILRGARERTDSGIPQTVEITANEEESGP